MFKKVLAVAVMLACGSASAATVYNKDGTSLAVGGRVQANYNSVFSDAEDDSYGNRCHRHATDADGDDYYADCKAGLSGVARLNVNARTPLGAGFYAKAFGEWQVAAETSSNGKFDTRYAYVGFDSDNYGSLVFGQLESAMYNVLSVTDVFEEYGFAAYNLGAGDADSERQEGQVVYNLDTNGFMFNLSYQTAGLRGVEGGVAVSAGYTYGETLPVSLRLGYDYYNLTGTDPDDYQSFGLGLSVGNAGDGFYGAFGYQMTDVDKLSSHFNSYEVALGYGLDNGLAFMAGYQADTFDSKLNAVSQLVLESTYDFNDQFKVIASSKFGVGRINNDYLDRTHGIVASRGRDHDAFSVGLQYNF